MRVADKWGMLGMERARLTLLDDSIRRRLGGLYQGVAQRVSRQHPGGRAPRSRSRQRRRQLEARLVGDRRAAGESNTRFRAVSLTRFGPNRVAADMEETENLLFW